MYVIVTTMVALPLCIISSLSSRLSLLSSSRRVLLLHKRPCSSIRRSPTPTQITQWRPTTQLTRRREVTATTTSTISMLSTTTTKTHYEDHSKQDSYEDAYFYEPGAYTEYLCRLVKDRLSLHDGTATRTTRKRIVLDIGGGTGNFTKMILKGTLNVQGIVIDPFLVDDDIVDDDDNQKQIRYVKQPAEKFINLMQEPPTDGNDDDLHCLWKKGYHQVLLKEVVHHFNVKDRIEIFRGIYDGLVPFSSKDSSTTDSNRDATENAKDESSTSRIPPSILIITRPKYDIDYPLWDEARTVWSNNQPSLETFVDELEAVGFTNVQHSVESYPCTIQLERWQGMIRQRFWSTFSHFNDDELEIACKTIAQNNEKHRHRMDDNGNLHFEDRLLFITACKEQ